METGELMERTFVPMPWLRTVSVEESIVLVDQRSGMYYGLNEVGSSMWRLLEAKKCGAMIISALLEEYDVDQDRLEADVRSILDDLLKAKLVE
jgi:hypothetical protein